MEQASEAMDNLTKSENQFTKTVQNFTKSANETRDFLTNYQQWFNVSQFFQDYFADIILCPLCK